MSSEFSPIVILHASLALDHNFGAFSFDMLKQLCSCHVLKIFMIAYVTAKFWALVHRMLLKLPHGLPDNHSVFFILVASVWKFTKINTILKNFVDVLHEVSTSLTARAADIVTWGLLVHTVVKTRAQLKLTMFTEKLIAIFAL